MSVLVSHPIKSIPFINCIGMIPRCFRQFLILLTLRSSDNRNPIFCISPISNYRDPCLAFLIVCLRQWFCTSACSLLLSRARSPTRTSAGTWTILRVWCYCSCTSRNFRALLFVCTFMCRLSNCIPLLQHPNDRQTLQLRYRVTGFSSFKIPASVNHCILLFAIFLIDIISRLVRS